MILKKCVTLQFCAKLLCTELVETYKKIKNGSEDISMGNGSPWYFRTR